jgi:hypothetical protein
VEEEAARWAAGDGDRAQVKPHGEGHFTEVFLGQGFERVNFVPLDCT